MSAATIPLPSATTKKPWQPSKQDLFIFRWVKFEGQTQSWVASQLGLHPSTVSRIVQRYERWIAHGGPGQMGELSHQERIRYQRWITYERNEILLASCIRLAEEMEHSYDTSVSTTQYPQHSPSQLIKVRTKSMCLDRTGGACRYIRLAFRINMEQQKLMEKDELTPLPPLAAADLDPDLDEVPDLFPPLSPLTRSASEGNAATTQEDQSASEDAPLTQSVSEGCSDRSDATVGPPQADIVQVQEQDSPSCADLRLPTPDPRPPAPGPITVIELTPNTNPMHAVHNPHHQETHLTTGSPCACLENRPSKKSADSACRVANEPPETVPASEPLASQSRLVSALPG